MNDLEIFHQQLDHCLQANTFVKLTLSKPIRPSENLQNVYVREITVKNKPVLSFTYRYKTSDQVKNYPFEEATELIRELLSNNFRIATLFTLEKDLVLKISKKGKTSLQETNPTFSQKFPEAHDRQKEKRAETQSYLTHLGIKDQAGNIIPSMADKYRQINKYLEIMEGLIRKASLPNKITVVDMGSGKGYLTFALYDFLKNNLNLDAQVIGIELRSELVDFCNTKAQECGFDQLTFVAERIENYEIEQIDILIALHACDTATDDAIYKGLIANSSLIVCAPCCHKQIRQQVKGKKQSSPLLEHGIFQERQFEMVTDTLRSLIMETKGYSTKIFEFVSNEHTRKNIMLVGSKTKEVKIDPIIKIEALKKEFGIEEHYLEGLIN